MRVGRQEAGRGRGDDDQVGTLAQAGVRDGVGCVPERRPDRLGRERRERRLTDEARAPGGHHRHDVRAGVDEAATDVDRLVGGDPAAHAEDDAAAGEGRHGSSVSPRRRGRRPRGWTRPRSTRPRCRSRAGTPVLGRGRSASSASGTGLPVAPPTPSILSAAISSKAIDRRLRAVEVTCGGTTVPSAVAELAVVRVDLAGATGRQRDEARTSSPVRSRSSSTGGFIIVSNRSANAGSVSVLVGGTAAQRSDVAHRVGTSRRPVYRADRPGPSIRPAGTDSGRRAASQRRASSSFNARSRSSLTMWMNGSAAARATSWSARTSRWAIRSSLSPRPRSRSSWTSRSGASTKTSTASG